MALLEVQPALVLICPDFESVKKRETRPPAALGTCCSLREKLNLPTFSCIKQKSALSSFP